MRETTQVEEFVVRGRKVGDKIRSIIRSGQAREILLEDKSGRVLMEITPSVDRGFMASTLDIVRGLIKTIKSCKLVVLKNQMLLFN